MTSDGHNITPVWDRSGDRLYFNRQSNIVSIDPRDPTTLTTVYSSDGNNGITVYPFSVTPAADIIVGTHVSPTTLNDIYAVTPGDPGFATPVLNPASREHAADISPDGRMVAYTSDATGREEIYVQPLSGPGQRTRVSADGGKDPVWSKDGAELFFRQVDQIMSARVVDGDPIGFAMPEVLFRAELDMTQEQNWDAGPDDTFVLVLADPTTTSEFQVVTNWFRALKEQTSN